MFGKCRAAIKWVFTNIVVIMLNQILSGSRRGQSPNSPKRFKESRRSIRVAAKEVQVVSTHRYITGPPYWRPIDEAASKGAHFSQVVNGKTIFYAFTRQQLIYHV